MTPARIDDLLRNLPSHDVDPARAEHLRRRAHDTLAEHQRQRRRPATSAWSLCYHRVVEPTALIALGLSYLALRVQATVALFQ